MSSGTAPAIEARHLRFRYRAAAAPAVDGVDLLLPEGSWGLLLGPTGAGKSTIVRCLNRSIPTFFPGDLSGRVVVGGRDTAGARVPEMARRVGVVFQDFETQIFSTTCLQEVAFAMENRALPPPDIRRRARELLDRVGLAGFEARDPATLSGGEKQRLVIAAILALEAPLLVLDEPASDLDPAGREAIYRCVSDLPAGSVLLVENDLEGVPATGPVTLLEAGRVRAAWPATDPEVLIRNAELLERCGVRPPPMARLAACLRGRGERRGGPGTPWLPENLGAAAMDEALTAAGWHVEGVGVDRQASGHVPTGAACVRCDRVGRVHGARAGAVRALDEVSLVVRRGEMVAIVGRNGSGKTTLAQVIAGLQRPDSGRVVVDGRDPAAMPARERARVIGYIFQNPDHQIFCATVREEVGFGPSRLGLREEDVARRVTGALATTGLEEAADEDPFALTKGERQRVALASVLAMEPSLVIMDEPTTGLDRNEQDRVMAVLTSLKERGHTIVIITHALGLVHPPVARVIVMHDGRIAADGAPATVLTDQAIMTRAGLRPPDLARLAGLRGVPYLTLDAWATHLRPTAERG